jgi:HEPN domain-containing protein
MSTEAVCNNCGATLTANHEGPCPHCGQDAGKRIRGVIRDGVPVGDWVSATWRERYLILLDTAKQLRDQGHLEAAIVTAQTACEVCTEVVVSNMLRASGIEQHVTALITESLRNYNLDNERVRKVYNTFTDDRIKWGEKRWQSFHAHVERRNEIVHEGQQATLQEANDSIATAESIIEYLLANRR